MGHGDDSFNLSTNRRFCNCNLVVIPHLQVSSLRSQLTLLTPLDIRSTDIPDTDSPYREYAPSPRRSPPSFAQRPTPVSPSQRIYILRDLRGQACANNRGVDKGLLNHPADRQLRQWTPHLGGQWFQRLVPALTNKPCV